MVVREINSTDEQVTAKFYTFAAWPAKTKSSIESVNLFYSWIESGPKGNSMLFAAYRDWRTRFPLFRTFYDVVIIIVFENPTSRYQGVDSTASSLTDLSARFLTGFCC